MPPVLRLDQVDSTQRAARALVHDGAPHGTLVVARRQTVGRGRLGRAWHSDEGGLWLSMIIRGALPATRAPRLTLGAAALALDALDALGARAAVKWPNDLLLPHPSPTPRIGPWRKLGGLLLEGVLLDGGVLRAAVLGVGINVRRPPGGFAAELAELAVSLQDAGVDVEVDAVLDALAPRLQAHALDAIDDAPFTTVLAALRVRSATIGRRVEIDGVVGLAERLDDDGALCVRDDAGALHTVRAGDVQCIV
ncbi:MAG: biotin--[acetyl-CoA-carboxylase] ligase [Deltaproteobacteria bacterium RBG_16_71_12]|nr:MAG: biotin--[acetyl-CoA-carboxylase] ligase [Deltaproteobacteria bacterium RBG_16_71_12]